MKTNYLIYLPSSERIEGLMLEKSAFNFFTVTNLPYQLS